MKKCMKETRELKECCPFPENESIKNDPECSHHLEGIEDKEKKEKMKAYNCFSECIFENKGLLVEGDFNGDEIKKMIEKSMTEANGSEFIDISLSSIDYCINERKIILIAFRLIISYQNFPISRCQERKVREVEG